MPEGWAWCRLKQLSLDMADGPFGSNLKAEHYTKNKEARIIQLSNIGEYGWREENTKYTTLEHAKNNISRSIVEPGNVVIAKMMPAGRAIICPNNEKMYVLSSDAVKLVPTSLINSNYLLNAINSPFFRASVTDNVQGTTRLRTSISKLRDCFFPVPPLNEQVLIVNAIENAISQIDILEQNKIDLQNLITQAKSKILDLAIHGKLVPQDPNDEPAEELLKRIATSDNRPYKKIDEDEALFDIPESWSWCTLGEIYTHTTGKALKKTNNKGTLRKYITTSNLYWNSFDFTEVREMYFTDDELEKCTIKKGDLILCNGGDVGRAAIWNYDYDICYQNHVSRLRPKNKNINNSFFLYVIMIYKQQGILNGKGVGITSLSASDLLSAVVPLPPYSEQNRIVEKIECLYGNLTIINNQL